MKPDDLGKSLQKQKPPNTKRGKRRNKQKETIGMNYTQSITDTSDLSNLLLEAELADRSFEAERNKTVLFELDEKRVTKKESTRETKLASIQEPLQIPRRPNWNRRTTAAQLESLEKQSFLEWRRQLAKVEENGHHHITPYEKNLEIWRQLWRVVENSDLVLQIVDARNPLLYFSKDLEKYVHQVSNSKQTALILNKADLLTEEMRRKWSAYFVQLNIRVVFFSAKRCSQESVVENNTCHHDTHDILSSQGLIDFMKSFRPSSVSSVKDKTSDEKPFVVGLVGYPNVGKSSTMNSLLVSNQNRLLSRE